MRSFGPLSAEADADLLSYFHITDQVRELVDFGAPRSRFILIARPGGGKTAIRKWLRAKAGADLTVLLTSEQTRLYLDDEEHPNAGDLRLLISTELLTALVSEAVEREILPARLQAEAKRIVESGWGELTKEFFKRKFGGVSILGCGITLKPAERRRYLQKIRQERHLEHIAGLAKSVAQAKKLLLVVDNPEELVASGLDDLTPDNAVRIGALLSVLGRVQSEGIRVVCFLKEQILQAVRTHYPDYQHFADQVEGLEWSAPDLIAMLESRVTTRLKADWSGVFTIEKDVFPSAVFPFLSNGPRDLLLLCNLAAKREGPIGKTLLLDGVRVLRGERLKDLTSQYKHWHRFDQFMSAMVTALVEKYGDRPIPRGGINAAFVEQYSRPKTAIHALRGVEWVDKARWEAPPVDERLFVAGCVGYIESGQRVFPWSGRDTTRFQVAESHFVSPLFSEAKGGETKTTARHAGRQR